MLHLLVLLLLLVRLIGELSTARNSLKFLLKTALALSCKLHSAIRPVVAVQYPKGDLGFYNFQCTIIALLLVLT